jgi:hypothetical protein
LKLFDDEEPARECWRSAAIAAVVGLPVDGHLISACHLFSAPALASKLHAGRMADDGILRLLETSSPMTAPAKERERVDA